MELLPAPVSQECGMFALAMAILRLSDVMLVAYECKFCGGFICQDVLVLLVAFHRLSSELWWSLQAFFVVVLGLGDLRLGPQELVVPG